MGEFLSAANKDKHSQDGENEFVNINYFILFIYYIYSLNLVYVICKDGEKDKKMLI